MNRLAKSSLTLAAALGLVAAAGPARADHGEWDHRGGCEPVVAPAPAYAYAPSPAPAYAPGHDWRLARFEAGRFRELREGYRRLDAARDRFYASWHGNPWRRDRFEAWYGARRAELDGEWAELEHGREHGRW